MTQFSLSASWLLRPLPRYACVLVALLLLGCWPGIGGAEPASLEQQRQKERLMAKLRRALKSKATVEQKVQRSREGTFRARAEHALSAETVPHLPLTGEWTDGEKTLILKESAGGRLTIQRSGEWEPPRSYRSERTTWTVSLEGDTIHLRNGQLRQLREQGLLELTMDGNRLQGTLELYDDFARDGQPAPGKIDEEKVDWRRRLELDTRTVLAWREALVSAPRRAEKAQQEREAAEAAERAKQEAEARRLEEERLKTDQEQELMEEGFEEEPSEEEQAATIPDMPPVPAPPVLEMVAVAPVAAAVPAQGTTAEASVDADFGLTPDAPAGTPTTAPVEASPSAPTTGAAQVAGVPVSAGATAAGQALPTTGVAGGPSTTGAVSGPATTASVAEAVPATGAEQVDPRTIEELQDYAGNYVPRLILAISDVRRLDQELAKLGISNPKASQELIANQFNQAVQTLSQMAGDRTPMGGELREAHRGLYQASKKYEAMLASYEELLQSRKSETLMEIAQESQEAAEELKSFKQLLTEFGKVSGVEIPALGF